MAEALRAADVLSGARSWRLRCRIYLAHLGDPGAALDVARDAVTLAASPARCGGSTTAIGIVRAALGWLSVAAGSDDFECLGDEDPLRAWLRDHPASTASQKGAALVGLIEQQALVEAEEQGAAAGRELAEDVPVAGVEQDAPGLSAVVFRDIGNALTGEGGRVGKELADLLGKPLALVPLPDLASVRDTLRAEFPYAGEVIDTVLRDLPLRRHVYLQPTILVGAPGCGKSRFGRRVLTALGVPHDVIPCGGISDGAFAGTARRWSSGEPSLPVALITRYKLAGPGAVLDEIEKAGTSRHNGQVHDALLAYFERETACRFHDPYVQAPCDLSHVTWLMTANSLASLSAPLRDRCRVIQFPEPGREHLPVLVRQITADILADQGLDQRWITPLDDVELAAIGEAWPGGSLRTLRRMIEVVLASRNIKH